MFSDEGFAAKLAAKARKKIVEKFSIDAIIAQYLDLYSEMLEQK